MILINKKSIPVKNNWFSSKLSEDFKVEINDKSIVIFGFNGIGKSTLFNSMKELNNKEIEYLDYYSTDQSFFSNKMLMISTNINAINQLKKKSDSFHDILSPSNQLKQNSKITSNSQAKTILKKLEEERKKNIIEEFKKPRADIQKIIRKYPSISAVALFNSWKSVSKASHAIDELDKNKNKLVYKMLQAANECVDEQTEFCPICDTQKDKGNIKERIKRKMENLSIIRSEAIEDLQKNLNFLDQKTLDEYINICADLKSDPDLLLDYSLCGGNIEIYDKISNAIIESNKINKEINTLNEDAKIRYQNVKLKQDLLTKDLKKYFDVESSSVLFDDKKFTIEIIFPRLIKTYSTGEINLILFLYRIYSFLGSDKTILILDDPASSLDLMNHYKIAYEIVKTSLERQVVILTHSVEFVNAINSQYRNRFDFYYLEECNNEIRIEKIKNIAEEANVISYTQLNNSDVFVKALIDREKPDSKNIDCFHYSPLPKYLFGKPGNISNHDMIKLIDDFTSFIDIDFYSNSFNKIKYICALRVWIEKKLYDFIDATDEINQEKFLECTQLNQRINFIFPINRKSSFNVGSLKREDFMSKKVMLNQGVHYYSQVMPMAYAINISLDRLASEISEIKKLF